MHPLAFEEGRLHPPPVDPLTGLGQGPADRGGQAVEPVLQDVVGRPLFEGFDGHLFAQDPRDEQERRVDGVGPGIFQGLQTVESRKQVVRQDQVELLIPQRFEVVVVPDGAMNREIKPVLGQSNPDQFGVERAVFEMQQVNLTHFESPQRSGLTVRASWRPVRDRTQPPLRRGFCAKVQRFGLERRLPGGGSFRSAQKTPRSWIAPMNSLKLTGLTT